MSKKSVFQNSFSKNKKKTDNHVYTSKTLSDKLGLGSYIVVGDAKDTKTKSPPTFNQSLEKIGVPRVKLTPLKTKVAVRVTQTGSANSVFNTVITLTPLAALDATKFAAVYDLARTTSLQMFVSVYTVNASGSPAAPTTQPVAFSVSYDPDQSGANTIGVENALVASQHLGPCMVTDQSGASVPDPIATQGNWSKRFKIPAAVVDPGILTDLLGSNWVSAADTNVVVGYIKPYVDGLGLNVHCVLDWFFVYDVEFKSRE